MSEQAKQAPLDGWQIGPYRFTRWRKGQTNSRGRWGCNAHGRGTDFHRTPMGAYVALRRWLNEPVDQSYERRSGRNEP